MTSEPAWVTEYFGGLHLIKAEIAGVMQAAGADLTNACIRHPRIERVGALPPAILPIFVIPFNGPRHIEAFSESMIVGSARRIPPEVSEIVERYADEFVRFRQQRESWVNSPRNASRRSGENRDSTSGGNAR